jgi:uncharacterized protein (TIGR02145 family)
MKLKSASGWPNTTDGISTRCIKNEYDNNHNKMKALPFLLLLVLFGCNKDPIFTDAGIFTDTRDDHIYKSIKIGDQNWMAENLAFLPAVSPSSDGSESSAMYYVYNYEGSSISEAKSKNNYTTYGVLYNWLAAKIACPAGWHLPTNEEWTTLTDYLTNNGYGYGGSGSDIGKSMAATTGWGFYSYSSSSPGTVSNDQASNNSSGFTALPGGGRNSNGRHGVNGGDFSDLGLSVIFWSSSEEWSKYPWYVYLTYDGDGAYRDWASDYRSGCSVRCLKDNMSTEANTGRKGTLR